MTPVRQQRPASTSGPVRRRISRACDQCNQLRTKCDGKAPCAHCVEFGLSCEYNRERKKRGKASRKEIAAQQAANAAAAASASPAIVEGEEGASLEGVQKRGQPEKVLTGTNAHDSWAMYKTVNDVTSQSGTPTSSAPSQFDSNAIPHDVEADHAISPSKQTPSHLYPHQQVTDVQSTGFGPVMMQPNGSTSSHPGHMIQDYAQSGNYGPASLQNDDHGGNQFSTSPEGIYQPFPHCGNVSDVGNEGFQMLSPQDQRIPTPVGFGMNTSDGAYGFAPSPMVGSPGWLSMPTPSAALYQQTMGPKATQHLRYPVLQPLLPYLGSIVPIPVACDLLELYFQSTSNIFQQPQSPYVLGYVFRKRSFLRRTNPRVCSPALLASILWVGAQTSESAFFTSPPSARGRICQKLLELTVGLLKPLIHSPAPGSNTHSPMTVPTNTVINGVALGGLGVTLPTQQQEADGSSPGAAAALDDVVTYIHLATVVSATEYKAASLRWWNAAWSLCRELKLGRELPAPSVPHSQLGNNGDMSVDQGTAGLTLQGSSQGVVSEERREERRRIWWLCYTMDRHLALCYNRPLFLLDQECEGLFQPIDDSIYQAGDYYTPEAADRGDDPTSSFQRHRGPSFECTGHSIFGYFTPLMTVLGEIVDLNHARNHPRFGLRLRTSGDWDEQEEEIKMQLEAYGRSLQTFAARYGGGRQGEVGDPGGESKQTGDAATPSGQSVASTTSHVAESLLQTRIVVAYGTHLMHTLNILSHGKWDPIALLDDTDLWISSQSFINATGHAVSAAEALSEILENDPDLSFMPFFFGIYLLQSSFLLLLIADKLRGEASQSVIKACETIVRAHEACVVTLNTEYQRNFRKVMRSALMQVRGRMNEDYGEQQMKRREVLALYRWTGDGSGLAL